MGKVIFVIGATAAGKSYFIEHNFNNAQYELLNVYDYQSQAYDEIKINEKIVLGANFKSLMKANEMLLHDIIMKLNQGHDVVVEQTFYMAKRRIAYIDEIRKDRNVTIVFYVLQPSESRWKENLKSREMENAYDRIKSGADIFEFPNVTEGIDEIYEVLDGNISLRMDAPKPEIVEKSRKELADEKARLEEEDEKRQKHKQLIESMNTKPFWHYCEVCGKKEFMTADEAFDEGWDYPPRFGEFGVLGPRTCGTCLMKDTLFWKVNTCGFPIVIKEELSPEELVTWNRIRGEPESLIE